MRRITKAALGGLAGCALVLGGTQAATGISSNLIISYPDPDVPGDSEFVDLSAEGPFDDASVTLNVKLGADGNTNFVLDVTGIKATAVGEEFGAHLHTLACDDRVKGDPDRGIPDGPLAGPHYNHEIVALGVPKGEEEISRRTEVWFDLVPGADGVASDSIVARDSTTVKFVPVDPEVPKDPDDPDSVLVQPMSIVLHSAATENKTGLAGARGACFTLFDANWAKTAP